MAAGDLVCVANTIVIGIIVNNGTGAVGFARTSGAGFRGIGARTSIGSRCIVVAS